jgi:flavin-dependent dehydrogenase
MNIAILGGGPAGAFAGAQLAAAGFPVTLFDEKLAWEKPCGGGLTYKALERYPFLASAEVPKRLVHRAVLVAANGARTCLRLHRPLAIYSRQILNGLLLERARRAGAALVCDRVVNAVRQGNRWNLLGRAAEYAADFCVVATGARNPLRDLGTRLTAQDAYVALGYFVPREQEHIEIQFLDGLEGYVWVFPRTDHLSVGICGKVTAQGGTPHLRRLLDQYMERRGIPLAGATFYCHLLPSLAPASFDHNRVAGEGWAAAGDAAGLVDPVTGEGLYYALRSADLLSTCLQESRAADYAACVRDELMNDLREGSLVAEMFYRGRFLLGAMPTRMVQFCRRSPTFEALMQDIFAGSSNYVNLRARLLRQLGLTLWEVAASCWRPGAFESASDLHEPHQIPHSL